MTTWLDKTSDTPAVNRYGDGEGEDPATYVTVLVELPDDSEIEGSVSVVAGRVAPDDMARLIVRAALAAWASRRERVNLPCSAQLRVARAALVRGQAVPVAVVDLEQPIVDLGLAGRPDRTRNRLRRLPAALRRAGEQADLVMRQLPELRAERRAEADGELDAVGRERRVRPLAEVASGGGGIGDRVAGEDQGAHRCGGV